MKLFLIIILLALFVLVGIVIYLYYLYRDKLYSDLIYIDKYLKNNISFNKDNINILLSNSFDSISPTSKFLIKNHNNIFSKILSKNDNGIITDFFESLGKGDINYEINNLSYYEDIFMSHQKITHEEIKSKGLLYLKLIIGIGLIVCIIII